MGELKGLPSNHGGPRLPKLGAGRPANATPEQIAAAARQAANESEHDPFGNIDPAMLKNNQVRANYNESKAASEAIKAKHSELAYRIKLGEYIERREVRSACSMAFASFAQSMRSMQDEMERTLALEPTVVEAIGKYVDNSLDQLSTELMILTGASE